MTVATQSRNSDQGLQAAGVSDSDSLSDARKSNRRSRKSALTGMNHAVSESPSSFSNTTQMGKSARRRVVASERSRAIRLSALVVDLTDAPTMVGAIVLGRLERGSSSTWQMKSKPTSS